MIPRAHTANAATIDDNIFADLKTNRYVGTSLLDQVHVASANHILLGARQAIVRDSLLSAGPGRSLFQRNELTGRQWQW